MLFTRKDIFKILLPLFVEQLLAVTIGMLDSIMVASSGEAAGSGVSLVDAINLLLSYIFSASDSVRRYRRCSLGLSALSLFLFCYTASAIRFTLKSSSASAPTSG